MLYMVCFICLNISTPNLKMLFDIPILIVPQDWDSTKSNFHLVKYMLARLHPLNWLLCLLFVCEVSQGACDVQIMRYKTAIMVDPQKLTSFLVLHFMQVAITAFLSIWGCPCT